jgi:Protein of unknown function (DUF5672)
MPPLDLPIAVVAITNCDYATLGDALQRTLKKITPRQILVFTDAPAKIPVYGAEYRDFDGDYVGAMRCLWYEVPEHVIATHMLWVQPDSWVLDAGRWTDEFLQYDYIGAPWPLNPDCDWYKLGYQPGKNVGNGGFSLRSRTLISLLAAHPDEYPLWLPEDDAICRRHRPRLEEAGIRFAPPELAARFSFECAEPLPEGTFGFHGRPHAARMRE